MSAPRPRNRDAPHPLYKTSSADYGKGAAGEEPETYHGRKGGFTKTFVGGPVKDCGLNVSMDKSRVAMNPGGLGSAPVPLL